VPLLSVVVPHWPYDDEANAALGRCVASIPHECEKIVVVNDGTGFARNVNLGLRLASGDYLAVVNNDAQIVEGDVHELCVPGTVTSPAVEGLRPGVAGPIEGVGFHGCFWVTPRLVLDRVGPLDKRFEGGFFEDDDFLQRLSTARIPTLQVASVRVRHVGGLTMLKLPDRGRGWYDQNERLFEEKWGFVPPSR